MNFNTKLVALLVCLLLIMSCQKDKLIESLENDSLITEAELYDANGVPLDYIDMLREKMGITSAIAYDESKGVISFDDTQLHEDYLALLLLEDHGVSAEELMHSLGEHGHKLGDEKGYTLSPNHIADVSLPSIVRCKYGQTATEFESHRMTISYAFVSDFPEVWKDLVRDAFDIWEDASDDKFEWSETSQSNAFLTIKWEAFHPSSTLIATARFPVNSIKGFHLGNRITFNSTKLDPDTGTSVVNSSPALVEKLIRNFAMHEVGHTLGLAHFHDGAEVAHHVPGTAVDQNQANVSIMNETRDIYRETLYPDDILTIKTLYPFTGNVSSAPTCACENEQVDIHTDMVYAYEAMGDVNNSGHLSTGDLFQINKYVLGFPNHILTPYDIQKAGAIRETNMNLNGGDMIDITRLLLGQDDLRDDIMQVQWVALADANGDGVLNGLDVQPNYLPFGSAPYNLDYSNRANFISEIQESVAMLDGDGSTYTQKEYEIWVFNF